MAYDTIFSPVSEQSAPAQIGHGALSAGVQAKTVPLKRNAGSRHDRIHSIIIEYIIQYDAYAIVF